MLLHVCLDHTETKYLAHIEIISVVSDVKELIVEWSVNEISIIYCVAFTLGLHESFGS